MNILIFSGTADGKELAERLSDLGHKVTVSVLTEYGRESQGGHKDVEIISGAKPVDEIASMLADFDVVIDATHPYATHIRESIKEACLGSDVKRYRLLRDESDIPDGAGAVIVDSMDEAAASLKEVEGNILITTGAKELSAFSDIDKERLFARILPMKSSLEACELVGIPRKNTIAMQGPFSEELNVAIMKQFDIEYLVTKDSGKEGGFDEKLKAAEKAGAKLIVIRRPDDEGMDPDEIIQEIEKEKNS